MNFLYPQILFGLAAIAIPVIIHFFNFQKPKKVLFSNTSFLKEVRKNNNQKLKVKHLLVLLSRILFIAFLVAAFAQPFMPSENASFVHQEQNVGVYLDNSYSMENEIDEEKAFDIAIKSINHLTDILNPNSRYQFLSNDFEGRDRFFKNKDKLNERLTELKYSSVFREGNAVARRMKLSQSDELKSVFWFSDFQKSTSGQLDGLELDTAVQYYLIPIQNNKSKNIYVDSLWLNTPFVKMNENAEIEVKLRNSGKEESKAIMVKLLLNDVLISTSEASVPADGFASLKFSFNLSDDKPVKGKIVLDDQPIIFDNNFNFVIKVAPKVKVHYIYQNKNKYLPVVYSNDKYFEYTESPVGQVNYSALSNQDLIILEGLEELPSSLENTLLEVAQKGGDIVVFPSESKNEKLYSGLLKSAKVFGLTDIKVDTSSGNKNFELAGIDLNNPFFNNIFEKKDSKMDLPMAIPVIDWNDKGQSLLKTKNGKSFLSFFNTGKGKVYLFSAPLRESNTNFFKHSIFVPIMYKIAFNSIGESEKLYYNFQETVLVLDSEEAKEKIYTLTSGDFKVIPSQRKAGNQLIMEVPKEQMQAGIYDINMGENSMPIAFNYGKEESELDFYTPEELKNLFASYKNVQIYQVENSAEFSDVFKKANLGVPLWKYFIILCLIFLLVEIMLIRFL